MGVDESRSRVVSVLVITRELKSVLSAPLLLGRCCQPRWRLRRVVVALVGRVVRPGHAQAPRPVWKSTRELGFGTVRNLYKVISRRWRGHRHAIEQTSRRWCGVDAMNVNFDCARPSTAPGLARRRAVAFRRRARPRALRRIRGACSPSGRKPCRRRAARSPVATSGRPFCWPSLFSLCAREFSRPAYRFGPVRRSPYPYVQ